MAARKKRTGEGALPLFLGAPSPPADVEIQHEPHGGWWIQRRRKAGTIFAAVHYTRAELVALRRALNDVLESA